MDLLGPKDIYPPEGESAAPERSVISLKFAFYVGGETEEHRGQFDSAE